MKAILTLCVLLAATLAHAQTPQIDLLETPPAAQAGSSPFDLLHQHDAPRASSPLTISAETDETDPDIDILYVVKPTAPEVVEAECACGCNRPGCQCPHAAAVSGKPIVRMRSASWCDVCRRAKSEIAKAGEQCPFVLEEEIVEDSKEVLPIFTWRDSRGKLWTTSDPQTGKVTTGYPGLTELSRQVAASELSHPPRSETDAVGRHVARPTLHDQITASTTRHFVAGYRGVPASIGKPGDSEKKSNVPSRSGSTTNASGSENKSPPPSGPSMAKPLASTRSPGGRS